jgi:bifunctional DNA-binding transcriptional regulator/antitoxin component of YhaV-PrlF toxin-antitoxin module
MNKNNKQHKFYGVTTIGEKGQIVIPVEARKMAKLKKSDKMLIFGMGDFLLLSKLSNLKKIASYLDNRLTMMRKIIRKNN